MTKVPYKRKPGDIEIRILKNGNIVSVTPDEECFKMLQDISEGNQQEEMETSENAANKFEQSE